MQLYWSGPASVTDAQGNLMRMEPPPKDIARLVIHNQTLAPIRILASHRDWAGHKELVRIGADQTRTVDVERGVQLSAASDRAGVQPGWPNYYAGFGGYGQNSKIIIYWG